jgi:hypothetical protein
MLTEKYKYHPNGIVDKRLVREFQQIRPEPEI